LANLNRTKLDYQKLGHENNKNYNLISGYFRELTKNDIFHSIVPKKPVKVIQSEPLGKYNYYPPIKFLVAILIL
jgi:hypothetical protein